MVTHSRTPYLQFLDTPLLSCLTLCSLVVNINCTFSSPLSLHHGVPQAFVPGPLDVFVHRTLYHYAQFSHFSSVMTATISRCRRLKSKFLSLRLTSPPTFYTYKPLLISPPTGCLTTSRIQGDTGDICPPN